MEKIKEDLKMKGKMLKTSLVVSALVASPLVVKATIHGADICNFLCASAEELGFSDGFVNALFEFCMRFFY